MRKPQSILFFSCQELFFQSANGGERRPGLLAESPGQRRGSLSSSEEEPVHLTEASSCEEQVAVERWNLLLSSRAILEVKKINTKIQAD